MAPSNSKRTSSSVKPNLIRCTIDILLSHLSLRIGAEPVIKAPGARQASWCIWLTAYRLNLPWQSSLTTSPETPSREAGTQRTVAMSMRACPVVPRMKGVLTFAKSMPSSRQRRGRLRVTHFCGGNWRKAGAISMDLPQGQPHCIPSVMSPAGACCTRSVTRSSLSPFR
ncbi:hypothetical protein D3C85_953000 [compost metagenome]